MMIVPHPLRVARRMQELTLIDLASRAGIAPGTIVNVEQRYTQPQRSTMTKLAAALKCDVAEITEA